MEHTPLRCVSGPEVLTTVRVHDETVECIGKTLPNHTDKTSSNRYMVGHKMLEDAENGECSPCEKK